jgi:hypothetical protein
MRANWVPLSIVQIDANTLPARNAPKSDIRASALVY